MNDEIEELLRVRIRLLTRLLTEFMIRYPDSDLVEKANKLLNEVPR